MATVIKPKRSEIALSIPTAGSLAVGEIAMNITDGKLYTKNSGGTVKEIGGAGAASLQDVTNSGAVTSNNITLNGSNLVFEGYLANAYETTLTVAEPTKDNTVTIPNASGNLAMDGDALAYGIVFGG